jgi:chorismate dehydratase
MNSDLIRVSVVKYLNSIPFVYGLQRSAGRLGLEISVDTPAHCAKRLAGGDADIGLIPISEFGNIPGGYILGDYCIGADGPVYSVCLASDSPVEELRRIYMDPHSRTSVNLVKVLARDYWKKDFEWVDAEDGFEQHRIGGTDGAVVIGDKVFGIAGRYRYQYDLAETWKKMTGLPFVFAAWVSNRDFDQAWKDEFNLALAGGVGSIESALEEYPYGDKLGGVDLHDYLTNKISYQLDNKKRAGMALFLKKLKEFNLDPK